jgi:hypothetical protein
VRDGEVRGAGADDGDTRQQGLRVPINDGGAADFVVLGIGDDGLQRAIGVAIEARDQEAPGLFDKALADRRNLVRRLAEAQHDLRDVVADAAVVVDLGESEVFVWQVTQFRQRFFDADEPTRDLLQEQP